jgi:phenylalanyl-tRNA synthetase alpha chain
MPERIAGLRSEAEAAVAAAGDLDALEELRVRYLGRKAELTLILRGVAELPAEERGAVGRAGNEARRALEELIEHRRGELEASALGERLAADVIDVTLPGTPPVGVGHLHLLTRTVREIEDVFVGLGYRILEGPEIEDDYYNFTALNHPDGHPARMLQDTFYVDPGTLPPETLPPESSASRPVPAGQGADALGKRAEVVGKRAEVGGSGSAPPGPRDVMLRTHTSPVQIRAMEESEPPIFIIVPGKVYRRDSDATHTPMFHQIEGLAVAEGITLADLQGTLLEFVRAIFGRRREARIRPHYFPFTEPSVEVDISCFQCEGSGALRGGGRCNLCKGVGWLEVLGAGMVDPNVFGFVREAGYDPERVQGFAFGLGIERIAMLKHGIPHLRIFFENDVRFLGQFS